MQLQSQNALLSSFPFLVVDHLTHQLAVDVVLQTRTLSHNPVVIPLTGLHF